MKNNINYQKILQNTIENIKNDKPTLLLHVCCGPCFTIPYEELKDHFDITLFYNNSNIYPLKEYKRRVNELKDYISNKCPDIKIIETTYNNEDYIKDLLPYKDMPEGHERCRICFRKRLKEGFDFAEKNKFDYFGTVMTISRYKNAQDINQIGLDLEAEHVHTKWLCADFKKNNGYENSLILIKENNMYLQEYCGCQFSYQKYIEKHQK